MDFKFMVALVLAACLDLADFIVGWIPLAGDALDIIGIILLVPFIKVYALVGVVEFFPIIGDFLPCFIGAVVMSKYGGKRFG